MSYRDNAYPKPPIFPTPHVQGGQQGHGNTMLQASSNQFGPYSPQSLPPPMPMPSIQVIAPKGLLCVKEC